MQSNINKLKGLLFINVAAIKLLAKGKIKDFTDYLVSIKKEYLSSSMEQHGINRINLENIAMKTSDRYFLPIEFCTSGSTPWYDLLTLAVLVNKYQPETIFEIGSFEGLGSLIMCNNSSNTKLLTLDLPINDANIPNLSEYAKKDHSIKNAYTSGKYFKNIRSEVKIEHLYGDSWNYDYSTHNDSVNFFFIDGAHTYKYVIKDTYNALKCIMDGGVISWHDARNSQIFQPLSKLAEYLSINHIEHTNICYSVIRDDKEKAVQFLLKELQKYKS